jgi:hypothetical protein
MAEGNGGSGGRDRVDLRGNIPGSAVPSGQVHSGKDRVRVVIVSALFIIFAGTVCGAFFGAMTDGGHNWASVKSLLDLLLPAETALIGVAVAFYMTD